MHDALPGAYELPRRRRSVQLATIRGCHQSIIKFTVVSKNFLIKKFLCFIKCVMLLCARDQKLPSSSVARGKRQDGANHLLVSRLCCEEEASYDVSRACSFIASQGLAYEERNES